MADNVRCTKDIAEAVKVLVMADNVRCTKDIAKAVKVLVMANNVIICNICHYKTCCFVACIVLLLFFCICGVLLFFSLR